MSDRVPRRVWLREFSMGIALLAIWIYFAIEQPVFLSARNLSLLSIELSVTATLALGMLLVLLPGHIDLSAGSGVGLCGAIAAVLVFFHGLPSPLALCAALVFALLLWTAMGALIVVQKIPAFIITLGGLLVFKGLHWLTIANQTVPVSEGGELNAFAALTAYYLPQPVGYAVGALVIAALVFQQLRARARRRRLGIAVDGAERAFLKLLLAAQLIGLAVLVCQQYRGVPLAVLVLGAVAVGVHVLTAHTPFGRYLYAIGSNEEAALVSGVPIRTTVIAAFTLMGAIVALTGFMQTAYGGASTSTVGNLMELDAVAACVIGGTSLRGGRGHVLGVLFGSLVMASLLNGLTLMAVAPEIKFIARGVVLSLAVWLDVKLQGR